MGAVVTLKRAFSTRVGSGTYQDMVVKAVQDVRADAVWKFENECGR